ncbi:hypothetical protein AAH979_26000 [Plantactinospora sp. ZYX-F-223]
MVKPSNAGGSGRSVAGCAPGSAFIDVFQRAFGYTPGTHNRRT